MRDPSLTSKISGKLRVQQFKPLKSLFGKQEKSGLIGIVEKLEGKRKVKMTKLFQKKYEID